MLKINKNLGVFSLKTLSESLQNRVPRVQVLLPLPKRNSHHFGDCFFFVRQNLSEARACRASSPSAAGGRCSEARMAQRSKYGVTPPYFGHRKRGCEATSSPFVYLRQSCGDNYCFCFTAILLTFPILIKLRRTVFPYAAEQGTVLCKIKMFCLPCNLERTCFDKIRILSQRILRPGFS